MDYKVLAERIKCPNIQKCPFGENKIYCEQCQYKICDEAATAITDLLARAEAAEARCETLEKMVKEYQDTIVPGYRERAEKAERERDAAVEQLHGVCSACVHYTPYHNDGPCATCTHEVACFVPEKATDKWKWRGQKEE